ncbi:MAG: hypothetical protein NTY42_20545 [Planctomycetota bacterium]|jgi:hypothetical protein|nr:hypothetical protein [Planctomycetota bacterium]
MSRKSLFCTVVLTSILAGCTPPPVANPPDAPPIPPGRAATGEGPASGGGGDSAGAPAKGRTPGMPGK